MLIQLPPDQVSSMWEIIGYGISQAKGLTKDNERPIHTIYMNNSFIGKFQIFGMFDKAGEDKQLYGIIITSIREQDMNGGKYVYLDTIYMYQRATDEMYKMWFDLLKSFAKTVRCNFIGTETEHEGVADLFLRSGFKPAPRVKYTMEI